MGGYNVIISKILIYILVWVKRLTSIKYTFLRDHNYVLTICKWAINSCEMFGWASVSKKSFHLSNLQRVCLCCRWRKLYLFCWNVYLVACSTPNSQQLHGVTFQWTLLKEVALLSAHYKIIILYVNEMFEYINLNVCIYKIVFYYTITHDTITNVAFSPATIKMSDKIIWHLMYW